MDFGEFVGEFEVEGIKHVCAPTEHAAVHMADSPTTAYRRKLEPKALAQFVRGDLTGS